MGPSLSWPLFLRSHPDWLGCRDSLGAEGGLMPPSKLVEVVETGSGCWLGYQRSTPEACVAIPWADLAELSSGS